MCVGVQWYILYYECVLITSVRNDLMCAVFQITDSILPHCGNVSHGNDRQDFSDRTDAQC